MLERGIHMSRVRARHWKCLVDANVSAVLTWTAFLFLCKVIVSRAVVSDNAKLGAQLLQNLLQGATVQHSAVNAS